MVREGMAFVGGQDGSDKRANLPRRPKWRRHRRRERKRDRETAGTERWREKVSPPSFLPSIPLSLRSLCLSFSLSSTLSILWSARSADHRMDKVPFNYLIERRTAYLHQRQSLNSRLSERLTAGYAAMFGA